MFSEYACPAMSTNQTYLTNIDFNDPANPSIPHQRFVHQQIRHPLHKIFYHQLRVRSLPYDLKYNASLRVFESFTGFQRLLEDPTSRPIIDFTKISLTYDNMLLQVNNRLPTLRESSERLQRRRDILDMIERMAQLEWEIQTASKDIRAFMHGELGRCLQDADESFILIQRLKQIEGQRMDLGLALWKRGHDGPGVFESLEENERPERYMFELHDNELPEVFSKDERFQWMRSELMGLDELSKLLG